MRRPTSTTSIRFTKKYSSARRFSSRSSPENSCATSDAGIPDKVRFFIWRQDSHIIAFGLCTVQGDRICHEYVGFDYSVAFELNLYYRVFHDIVEWAIANGYKRFYTGVTTSAPKCDLPHSSS